jgi:hypothetical protein
MGYGSKGLINNLGSLYVYMWAHLIFIIFILILGRLP